MEGLMPLMGGALADRTDQSFGPTGWIDADEVEDFALVKFALRALQISHSEFFYLIGFDAHSTWIIFWILYIVYPSFKQTTIF
jgi:hypothetical protein